MTFSLILSRMSLCQLNSVPGERQCEYCLQIDVLNCSPTITCLVTVFGYELTDRIWGSIAKRISFSISRLQSGVATRKVAGSPGRRRLEGWSMTGL
jgi:hypothetical protein